ncbi:MAG: MG2 domain-containing protein [Pirellulales bacterium]
MSDGSEIVSESKTGKDGVCRTSPERLKQADDVRVFAESAGHTASNQVSLSGVGVAQGLEERGFLYSDRNGYRPGQVVHVRGILRAVVDDRYVAVPKRKYRLDVFDGRSRLIYTTDVTTGDFGSFHTFFSLPEQALPVAYRVQASDIDGRSFAGGFQVENYQVEPVRLAIDLPRKVFFRGEEISGTIKAEYYYGTPLVGREVHYTLGDGETHVGTTDDQGRVAFKFATREFREAQGLKLVAQLPERNLYTAQDLVLAVRAFSIGISLPRDVVTVGESFPATFKTTAADGSPTGEKLQVEIVERTMIDGQAGERIVSKHEVTTDGKTGEGRLVLTLEKGAGYFVRAKGSDRFANPVAATTGVFVSGDEDAVRLRILADVHNYRVGDEAVVRVDLARSPGDGLGDVAGCEDFGVSAGRAQDGRQQLEAAAAIALGPEFLPGSERDDRRSPCCPESERRAGGESRNFREARLAHSSAFRDKSILRRASVAHWLGDQADAARRQAATGRYGRGRRHGARCPGSACGRRVELGRRGSTQH